MNSLRLPGKVMMRVAKRPLIEHMIRRVKNAKLLDEVWLATSNKKTDDCLEKVCSKNNIHCFRGSEEDVFSRYEEVAKKTNPDFIVRLTGDCPLIDPNLIDLIIQFALKNIKQYDYVSNSLMPTFPDGLDIEVFKTKALFDASKKSSNLDREHVTPQIHKFHSKKHLNSHIGHFKGSSNFSHLRLTLDEKEDFELIRIIFEKLYYKKEKFTWLDVISLLTKEPDLISINRKYKRNESFYRQLAKLKD